MRTYTGETFAEVYELALTDVLENPEFVTSPRGMKVNEVTNAALIIEDPYFPLYENERRGSQLKYIAGELIWYFTGRKDTKFISKFAKFWDKIDNGDGTVNSAYGNLIFTTKNEYGFNQYSWALKSLIKDKDSRQAIMHFNTPKHQWENNKDFVCTLAGVFQIRNNRLNFTVDMRSNDIILGTATDVAFFCLLQQQMYEHLKPYYPELEMGTYTHFDHSLHLYERHFDLVREMLKYPFEPLSYPGIREFFITPDGNPTDTLKVAEYEVEHDDIIIGPHDDPLFNWIHEAILEIL